MRGWGGSVCGRVEGVCVGVDAAAEYNNRRESAR